MSDVFKVEIVNPEKFFLLKEDVSEVVVPSFEGDMGILKDHISIISFLRPGLLRIIDSKSTEETYYVEDGIIEFKNNCLSVLTSNIFDISEANKTSITEIINNAEKEAQDNDLDDQKRYLIEQKIEVLKSISTIN